MAQVNAVPAEIEVAFEMPVTTPGRRGVGLVVPRPSWPMSSAPQHRRPELVRAQLWRSPSARACAFVTPVTLPGPRPATSASWPEAFAPQHQTSPVTAAIAQMCRSPTATEVAAGMPGTSTGFADHSASAGLYPNWPESFEPQHCTLPSTTTQVVSPPAASAVAGQHAGCEAQRKKPLQV